MAEAFVNLSPDRRIDNRRVLAGIIGALVIDLAGVDDVGQQPEQAALGEGLAMVFPTILGDPYLWWSSSADSIRARPRLRSGAPGTGRRLVQGRKITSQPALILTARDTSGIIHAGGVRSGFRQSRATPPGTAPHSGGKGGSFLESRAGSLLESAEGRT